ncbi:MAG TPA: SDR family oxidoreductase [Thermoanaerobaculia bacterium]|nr:SDR family oxidoreductase [Thermoanaerobaculia bacterium]
MADPRNAADAPVPAARHGSEIVPTVNPKGEMAWESSPSRYIAKVSLATGREILRPIDPDDLLVHAHRDKNPIEVTAQFLASRAISWTGNEETVRDGLRRVNLLGLRLAEALGQATGSHAVEKQAKRLIGVSERDVFFKFREASHLSEKEVKARIEKLQKDARALLRARGRNPRLHVLLTGATGFLGKELLFQAARDRRIERVVSVVRPERIRDPKTKEVVKVLTPKQRGALLLRRLAIPARKAKKFVFVDGDIEKPDLGIDPKELSRLRRSITHVVHCAASVAFDDTYENSFRANVQGARNALGFSLGLQGARGSKFIQHVAIETSYIHGRKKRTTAQESALVFPRNFYNNFYELTKAMASLETDYTLIEKGLRVSQLLPSIVIGHSKTGNNRGDTKVVNAPINAFGRSKEAMEALQSDAVGRGKAWLIGSIAQAFPGDRSAELNLVPVDRVVEGILASLTVPASIGERIHLATDNRIRSEDIARITREEIGIDVRLADPTLFRNVTLPVVKTILEKGGEPKLANALEKLGTIFGGYNEWGQPIHDVGNDVRILGLPLRRPNTEDAFRMLCRHNKYVQEFGRVRDLDEIARRERLWEKVLADIEHTSGREAAAIPPADFRRLVAQRLEIKGFKEREK